MINYDLGNAQDEACRKLSDSMREECAKRGIHPSDLEWRMEVVEGKISFRAVGLKKPPVVFEDD